VIARRAGACDEQPRQDQAERATGRRLAGCMGANFDARDGDRHRQQHARQYGGAPPPAAAALDTAIRRQAERAFPAPAPAPLKQQVERDRKHHGGARRVAGKAGERKCTHADAPAEESHLAGRGDEERGAEQQAPGQRQPPAARTDQPGGNGEREQRGDVQAAEGREVVPPDHVGIVRMRMVAARLYRRKCGQQHTVMPGTAGHDSMHRSPPLAPSPPTAPAPPPHRWPAHVRCRRAAVRPASPPTGRTLRAGLRPRR
jgi:hypothetical protein